MDLGLKDKVIMVAASSQGLGYAIARACALEGAKLSLASRRKDEIASAAQSLATETGSKAWATTFDAREPSSILKWTEETLEQFGTIDGLVVNAGGPPAGKFEDFDDNHWQAAFELTLMSSVRMIRSALPVMKKNRKGAIITVTSSSIREPIPHLLLSNVMRSGVASLAKSLATEVGQYNIRINNLVPGRIDTDRVKSLDSGLAVKRGLTEKQVKDSFEAEIPLGRYGEPIDFGKAGAFLLSDAASYISGATLLVDGGKASSIW